MTSYASVRKDFLRYTSLNILGMIGLSVYILADTFFISKGLGSDGLAALNLAIPVYSFIHGTGLMLGMGGATRYSIFKAQNDFQKSNQIFTNTLYTAGIFSAFYFLLGLFFFRSTYRNTRSRYRNFSDDSYLSESNSSFFSSFYSQQYYLF